MPRFFVSAEDLSGDVIALCGEALSHARVLRLKEGERVTVCDGKGRECICTVTESTPDKLSLSVCERRESLSEPSVQVCVYVALPKADKLEHVIQKATELGACQIIAFSSERCVSRPDEKSISKKLMRWQKIAASAAEQSGRGIVPEVRVLPNLLAACREASRADLSVLFYENEEAYSFSDAIREHTPFSTAALLTGPEGGLSEEEVRLAREAGLKICTLGRRILRCETAPLCALSALLFAAGEF